MTENPLLLFLLALIALCAVLTTLSLLISARSLWKTSHQLELVLGSAQQLLLKTHRAAAGVEGFFERLFSFLGGGTRLKSRSGHHRTTSHVTNKRRIG